MSESSIPTAFAAASQLVTGAGTLREVTLRETAGTVANVQLFDNTSGSGTLILTARLAANGSFDLSSNNPRRFTRGLYAVVSGGGTVEGSIFV